MQKEDQIREILLMPIICQKGQTIPVRNGGMIISGQVYYSSPDPDMTDFAVGFYEIVYRSILGGQRLLGPGGRLKNREFAGDTMNSFNTAANGTPGAGRSCGSRARAEQWPDYLRNYFAHYHCLANFWLLPIEIGRTTRGSQNKTVKPVCDYMDRFLEEIRREIRFNGTERDYFRAFSSWADFSHKHWLIPGYVDHELGVDRFSQKDAAHFIGKARQKMVQRADSLAESDVAEELWEYFKALELL